MEGINEDAEATAQYISESPALDGLRFMVMRLIRLVGTLVCEAVALAACLGIAMGFFATMISFIYALTGPPWSKFFAAGHPEWWARALFCYPVVALALSLAALPAAWGMVISLGTWYRYKWSMPGIMLVVCGSCKQTTQDYFYCEHCYDFRYARVASWLILQLNRVVTLLWMAHDTIFFFAAI